MVKYAKCPGCDRNHPIIFNQGTLPGMYCRVEDVTYQFRGKQWLIKDQHT